MPNASEHLKSFLGIDLSGRKLRAAVVNSSGAIDEQHEESIAAEHLVEQVTATVKRMQERRADITAAGIAIP